MMSYTYRAIDVEGKTVAGTEAAETPRDLVERLHMQGMLVTEVREVGGAAVLGQWRDRLRGASSKDLALLFRQMATLLAAGIPLAQGLAVLELRFPHLVLRRVLVRIRTDVEEGYALSTALARHPQYFSGLVVHTVRAGEVAGALDVLLPRLAAHYEKEHALKQKLRAAAIYPSIVAVVSAAAVLFLMTYVVPTLVVIFEGLQAPLPWQTRLLIGAAGGLRAYWLSLLVVSIALIGAAIALRRTSWGTELADVLSLSLPGVGRFNQQVITSRFCRTLATLLAGGVPLLRAMEIVAQLVGNRVVTRAVLDVQEGIRIGGRLGRLLARQQVFPALVAEMVAVGEESGNVDMMLDRVADFQDIEIEYALTAMATALEPILILSVGVVVGFVVVSMYLPLFDLVRAVR